MTIHVGLIGAGNISGTHARACSGLADVRVAAVHAPTRAHAARLAAEFGAATCDTLEALLAHRPMDMVAVGSPSGRHAEHGIAAARHGLHVLVEKPIDVTVERADALIAAAADGGVTLGVVFQDRFKPGVQRLKALVDEGRLGSPILATARVRWYRPPSYYRESAWRGTRALDGGGALMNQGVHTVDLLLWLFGPVRRVFGKTATRLHAIEVEDTAVAVLEFANGALGTIEATTAAFPGYPRQIDVTGSNGTAVLAGDELVAVDLREGGVGPAKAGPHDTKAGPHDTKAGPHDSGGNSSLWGPASAGPTERLVESGLVGSGSNRTYTEIHAAGPQENVASPVVSDVTAHRAVFADFIHAMTEGARPCCDGAEGRRSVEVIEAIYRASRTGAPVEL